MQQILTMNGLVVLALVALALPALEARVSPHIIGGKLAYGYLGYLPWFIMLTIVLSFP